ncbi:MAG: 4-hydroxybutyrate--acetyl-CoA CoA transferase [Clostridiales bacterium]|jgi:acyl-CoA hydrolase|nr:4-hydroxybutyrate--acetyl-CoA CoA transferase [Clostridiales bacterium]
MDKYDYKEKLITVDKALGLVKSGDQIITGLGAAEAAAFFTRFHEVFARGVKDVTVNNCLPMCDGEYLKNPVYAGQFDVNTWFYTPTLRKAHALGNVAYIPNHLHLAGIKRLQHIEPNIYIGNAGMPDRHGYVSLSLSNTYEKRVIENADLVILEINPNVPRTFGDVELHLRDVDYVIETDYAVPEVSDAEPSELDYKIGKLIADEINDGDCIQLGIGSMPNAIAKSLYGKKDLGVHTEMLTSEIPRLARAGVINGRKKRLMPGKMVCTFILGTRDMYDFVDDNPAVAVMDGAFVNDPYVIGQNDNQVSINSSIEVDITGQCASESIGVKQISGTGGQADTAIGAQISKGGRSYICLYSAASVRGADGEKKLVSKIVPRLNHGAVVSLSRNDVDRVVTEYGIAELRGTNVRERAERLIGIAHPDFRDGLMKEAYDLGIIGKRLF